MFKAITIRGRIGASVVWGYRTAATFTTWTISRHKGAWLFRGTLERADRFQLRQRPLEIIVPWAKGFFTFGVESIQVSEQTIAARLRPPEA